MNKFIIFVLLFLVVFCSDDEFDEYIYDGKEYETCSNVTNPSVDACNAVTIPDEDYKCCYQSYKEKGETVDDCIAFKKSKVKDYVKEGKKEEDSFSVDCSSNYLSKALIILFSLLF